MASPPDSSFNLQLRPWESNYQEHCLVVAQVAEDLGLGIIARATSLLTCFLGSLVLKYAYSGIIPMCLSLDEEMALA